MTLLMEARPGNAGTCQSGQHHDYGTTYPGRRAWLMPAPGVLRYPDASAVSGSPGIERSGSR